VLGLVQRAVGAFDPLFGALHALLHLGHTQADGVADLVLIVAHVWAAITLRRRSAKIWAPSAAVSTRIVTNSSPP